MVDTQLHLRFKRRNETVFVIAQPSDSFGKLRVKLAEIVGVTTDEVRILGPDKATIMPEEALLSDHRVEDDAVLYFVRREGTAWEAVDIVPFPTGEEADAEDEG